jgi:hypothetical protein
MSKGSLEILCQRASFVHMQFDSRAKIALASKATLSGLFALLIDYRGDIPQGMPRRISARRLRVKGGIVRTRSSCPRSNMRSERRASVRVFAVMSVGVCHPVLVTVDRVEQPPDARPK